MVGLATGRSTTITQWSVFVQISKLVKIGQAQHVNALYEDGELFIRRVLAFRDIEANEVGDKYENLLLNYQSHKVSCSWGGIEFSEESGLVGQVQITDNSYNPFSYCMYGFATDAFPKKQLIDTKCKEFGDSAVFILDVKEFFNRVKSACLSQGIGCKSSMVSYEDFASYHGKVGPFVKDCSFKHQSEFRMLFEIPSENSDTAKIHIGSLRDIALVGNVDKINKELSQIYEQD